jgi:hypothetical protein
MYSALAACVIARAWISVSDSHSPRRLGEHIRRGIGWIGRSIGPVWLTATPKVLHPALPYVIDGYTPTASKGSKGTARV